MTAAQTHPCAHCARPTHYMLAVGVDACVACCGRFACETKLRDGVDVPSRAALPRLVILEHRFAGDVERNVAYARRAMRDALLKGDAPMASALLYTQPGVLDDDVPEERTLGIEAGLAWGRVADASVIYADLGVSLGMRMGIERAHKSGRPVEVRYLNGTPCSVCGGASITRGIQCARCAEAV